MMSFVVKMAIIGFLLWMGLTYIIEYHWEDIMKFFSSFSDKRKKYKATQTLEKELEEKIDQKKIDPPKKIDRFPSSEKK